MFNFTKYINTIKKSSFSNKDFCKNSLCPLDYKELITNNNNQIPLKNLVVKHMKGKDPGSNDYMKSSRFRFLKTGNMDADYCINDSLVEYCKPPTKNIFPQKNDIFVAIDGKGDGLGEVSLYNKDNSKHLDTIASGILCLTIQSQKLYYVLGFLKSEHFKTFIDINTAQGSTMRHSKLISLEYRIPFPTKKNNNNPDEIEQLLSVLVRNIIDKEENIKARKKIIDDIIQNELNKRKIDFYCDYKLPRISEIKESLRLDTGLYTKNYKNLSDKIKYYKNGYFSIPIKYIKSGSTPKTRIFNAQSASLVWATPTDITDYGFLVPNNKILIPNTQKYNLTEDSILIINRTSKGKKGEYVGIACYYDTNYYGYGHHNQGVYRISNYSKTDKLFIVAFFNSSIARKLCGNISFGSKMKEMKSFDFSEFKIPNFPQETRRHIAQLYYSEDKKNIYNCIRDYIDTETTRNKHLGIFQLYKELNYLKLKVSNLIEKICYEDYIEISDFIN